MMTYWQRRDSRAPVSVLITSMSMKEGPAHDEICLFNRGANAGVLTVKSGDGRFITAVMAQAFGLALHRDGD